MSQHCASYDAQVAEWLWAQTQGSEPPPELCVPMQRQQSLRYGENPHQSAAFYTDLSLQEASRGGVATAQQLHGKEMSYNNYLDADAAFSAVCDFPDPTCVVVKHTNPCGVATMSDDLLEAYRLAVRADPVSAFGGIVAFNRAVDEDMAKEIREFRSPTDGETRMFYEIVIAPEYSEQVCSLTNDALLTALLTALQCSILLRRCFYMRASVKPLQHTGAGNTAR